MMVLVGIGGTFGAIARFLLGKWIASRKSSVFPFGTWIINITGSFILGILASLYVVNIIPEWFWLLFGIGLLGAFTTFSTFGFETIQMLKNKDTKNTVIYVFTSVVLGITFAWIGGLIVNVTV